MVYEWGKLPSTGYEEEIPDSTELHKGDLILHEQIFRSSGITKPLEESTVGEAVRNSINDKGQRCMYVYVQCFGVAGFWRYYIKTLTYIQKASPLTGLEIVLIVIAICAVVGLAVVVTAPVLWKWSGLSPEEVQAYLGALPLVGGTTGILFIVAIIIVAVVMFLWMWKKK